MKPKISIITPIYNATAYIETAYNSIKKQTLIDVEWIVIDDGSTDGSFEKVTGMSQSDNRITVLTQNHAGAGTARNLGIENSSGDYICFLDIDDEYYDADALEKMYDAGKTQNADIVAGFRVIESFEGIKEDTLFKDFEISSDGSWINFEEYQEDYHFHNYMFSRKLILDNELHFPCYRRYQDPVFCLQALVLARRVLVVSTTLYKYTLGLQNPDLVTQNIADVLRGIRDNLILAGSKGYHELFDKLIFRVNTLFFPDIMLNYSVETLKVLIEIEEICKAAGNEIPILALTHINYNAAVFEKKKLYDDIINRFNYLTEGTNQIEKYLLDRGLDEIVIYGSGNLGRKLLQSLSGSLIKIVAVIDENTEGEIEGYRKFPPETLDNLEFKAVIITPIQYGNMIRKVQKYGVHKVLILRELVEQLAIDNYPDKPGLVL